MISTPTPDYLRRAPRTRPKPCCPNSPSKPAVAPSSPRSEEHTSELQSQFHLVCRLLLEKKKKEQHDVESASHKYLKITRQVQGVDVAHNISTTQSGPSHLRGMFVDVSDCVYLWHVI